jgi:hypothetical protein
MNCIRISVADNGLILSYDDPEVRRNNRESDGPWQDPERQRVYETPEALLVDLTKLVPLLKAEPPEPAPDAYETAIDQAFAAAEQD